MLRSREVCNEGRKVQRSKSLEPASASLIRARSGVSVPLCIVDVPSVCY